METESKQSCVLVYRYTKGITIVLSFRREPLFSCSILLGFLYRFFCTAPADHRAGTRGHNPTRPGVDVFAASLQFKNDFFIQNSRIQ